MVTLILFMTEDSDWVIWVILIWGLSASHSFTIPSRPVSGFRTNIFTFMCFNVRNGTTFSSQEFVAAFECGGLTPLRWVEGGTRKLEKKRRQAAALESATHLIFRAGERWRREGDSNPRYPCGHSGFQDRCNRPLCHLSRFSVGAENLVWEKRRSCQYKYGVSTSAFPKGPEGSC